MFVATSGSGIGDNVTSKAWAFGFDFNTVKRIIPTIHTYSITGVVDQVTAIVRTNGVVRNSNSVNNAFWQFNTGTKRVNTEVVGTGDIASGNVGGTDTAPTAQILYHFTADARIGK